MRYDEQRAIDCPYWEIKRGGDQIAAFDSNRVVSDLALVGVSLL